MTAGVDPELQALTERIAAVRTTVDREKAERARIERTQAPGDDAPERELVALRDQLAAARARLAVLKASPVKRGPSNATREMAARRTMYILGVAVGLPGAVPAAAMLIARAMHPEEALDPVGLIVTAPLLILGLAFFARGRFANYNAGRDDLDGEFLP